MSKSPKDVCKTTYMRLSSNVSCVGCDLLTISLIFNIALTLPFVGGSRFNINNYKGQSQSQQQQKTPAFVIFVIPSNLFLKSRVIPAVQHISGPTAPFRDLKSALDSWQFLFLYKEV
eukprot:1161132-Pelagomonas_calceolata.AAC.1